MVNGEWGTDYLLHWYCSSFSATFSQEQLKHSTGSWKLLLWWRNSKLCTDKLKCKNITKEVTKPWFSRRLWDISTYFQAATLSRTEVRWMCFSSNFSLPLLWSVSNLWYTKERSTLDIQLLSLLSNPLDFNYPTSKGSSAHSTDIFPLCSRPPHCLQKGAIKYILWACLESRKLTGNTHKIPSCGDSTWEMDCFFPTVHELGGT